MSIIDSIKEAFCRHDYELVSKESIYRTDFLYPYKNKFIGYKWTYICKKCGHVKIVRNYE